MRYAMVRSMRLIVMLMGNKMILLFVGGGLGTIARYLLGKWFNEQPWGQAFPFGT